MYNSSAPVRGDGAPMALNSNPPSKLQLQRRLNQAIGNIPVRKLPIHQRHRPPSPEVKCDICGRSFSRKFTLYRHKQKLHPPKLTTRVNPVTTTTSSSVVTIGTSIPLVAASANDLRCPHCNGPTFGTRRSLRTHVSRIHPYVFSASSVGSTDSSPRLHHRRHLRVGF
jgi:uncharacterized C2H2 Zn-finger protein